MRPPFYAIYMVGTFVALAIGQLLIARAEVEATSPFMIVVLFAGALVMVSTTPSRAARATSAPILPYPTANSRKRRPSRPWGAC
jgi:hypothetical protein